MDHCVRTSDSTGQDIHEDERETGTYKERERERARESERERARERAGEREGEIESDRRTVKRRVMIQDAHDRVTCIDKGTEVFFHHPVPESIALWYPMALRCR